MTIKASGRAALILTTGIWICLGGPSLAATATDSSTAPAAVKHHHLKKYTHRKTGKVADKSAVEKKTADAAAEDSDNSAAVASSQMPAAVANANAQLVSTAAAASTIQAAPVDAQATAAAPVVAADQLNDVDRALQQPAPAAAPVTVASAETPAETPPPPMVRASSESSTWDQTSLIGKIFIGFGALLTMASAARMFMA
jgi:hypothetical protein